MSSAWAGDQRAAARHRRQDPDALQLGRAKAKLHPGSVLLDLGSAASSRLTWPNFPARPTQLADFGALLAGWHDAREHMPLPDLFDRILEDTGYHEYLNDGTEEGRSRWENVQELRRLAYEYEDRGLTTFWKIWRWSPTRIPCRKKPKRPPC
jgi:DNA helicase II / ATP-dependent DNA helicase PcrA